MNKRQRRERWGRIASIACKALILVLMGVGIISMSISDREHSRQVEEPAASPIAERTPNYGESRFLTAAQNRNFELLANPATGEIAVKNRSDGSIWYSNPQDRDTDEICTQKSRLASQFYVTCYLVGSKQETVVDNYEGSIQKGGMEFEQIENGVKFTFSFPTQGMVIPISYTIDEEGLSVEILTDELQELYSERFLIGGISVLPFFGAGGLEEEGYLFVPDGSGALIDFNNGRQAANTYSGDVYGRDLAIAKTIGTSETEEIRLPVFGIKKEKAACMGVITQGDAAAQINASVSRKTNSYNSVYPHLITRQYEINSGGENLGSFSTIQFMDYLRPGDRLCVRYFFLEGEDADYSGMARRYREYLEGVGGLNQSPLAQESPFVVNLYGAASVEKTIMGINTRQIVPLTSYESAMSILNQLQNRGIDSLAVNYQGAFAGGLENCLPVSASPEGVLGSEGAYRALLERGEKENIPLFIEADFYSFYQEGNGYSTVKHSVRSVYDSPVFQYRYAINTSLIQEDSRYWLLRPGLVSGLSEKFQSSALTYGIQNLSFAGSGEALYSDFTPDSCMTRSDSMAVTQSLLQTAEERFDHLLVHGGNAYSLRSADMVLDAPTDSSRYDMTDRAVPFYQIVTRGAVSNVISAVNLGADRELAFLKALETGSCLSYSWIGGDVSLLADTDYNDLFGADVELWLDIAASQYHAYQEVMGLVAGQPILRHRYLQEDVTETTFASGARIVVNYGDAPCTVESVSIPGRGYHLFL